ncbi:ATP-binding protein [Thiosulfativibrio zosterae]|nr:ATP-binding protein [Thiosulfativibrio zosterae]
MIALFLAGVISIFNQPMALYIWAGYMFLVSSFRFFLGKSIQSKIANHEFSQHFDHQLYSMVVLTALGWASLPMLMFGYGNEFVNAYITITLAGMVAGSITSLTPIKHYFYTFVVITLLPLMLAFLQYGELEKSLFALVIFIFGAFVVKNGRVFNEHLLQNFELNLKNSELIENLKVQTDKANNANRLKGQFLANMSHEIRTPMNGILGFIDILKELEKDPQKLRYLNIVKNSSEDLMNIINDILDFSKIESNQFVIQDANNRVRFEIEQCIALNEEKMSQKDQKIITCGLEDLPEYLRFDPLRFHQILNNILANAIKFSPNATQIELTAHYDKIEQLLKISVKDHGIGIAQDKLDDIFRPFIQADGSVTREYGGTGLGLSISSRLVELMGGKISVTSEVGKGSEFTFSIIAPINNAILPKKVHHSKALQQFNGHILVVEDNLVNQKVVSALLKRFGLTYEIASDGLEGVKSFEKGHFDLILMDQNMPNMSGTEACVEIRKKEQAAHLKPIPIIALTANAMEGDREFFINSGMDEYITKPIKIEVLQEVFSQFLAAS